MSNERHESWVFRAPSTVFPTSAGLGDTPRPPRTPVWIVLVLFLPLLIVLVVSAMRDRLVLLRMKLSRHRR